jgi:hypothetical protein
MKSRLALMLVAASLATAACGPRLPSDAELITTFNQNRRGFESVRQIVLQTDGFDRIEEHDDPRLLQLTTAQQAKVAGFMEKAGVTLIDSARGMKDSQSVVFTIDRSGLATGGSMKGIEWRSEGLRHVKVLDTLDDASDRRGLVTDMWFNAVSPLGGGWSLYLSRN